MLVLSRPCQRKRSLPIYFGAQASYPGAIQLDTCPNNYLKTFCKASAICCMMSIADEFLVTKLSAISGFYCILFNKKRYNRVRKIFHMRRELTFLALRQGQRKVEKAINILRLFCVYFLLCYTFPFTLLLQVKIEPFFSTQERKKNQ